MGRSRSLGGEAGIVLLAPVHELVYTVLGRCLMSFWRLRRSLERRGAWSVSWWLYVELKVQMKSTLWSVVEFKHCDCGQRPCHWIGARYKFYFSTKSKLIAGQLMNDIS